MHKIMGIVAMDEPDMQIEGMCDYRPLSVVSYMGRYRLIDFVLTNFSISRIDQIQVYFRDKPRSLIEHISGPQQYNINSKSGKIHLLSAEVEGHNSLYNNDLQAYLKNMRYIDTINADYVVLAPSHAVYRVDFQAVVDAHIASNADVSVLYSNQTKAQGRFLNTRGLALEGNRVVAFTHNHAEMEAFNVFLDTYVLSKDLFEHLVEQGSKQSSIYWFYNVIQSLLAEKAVVGYEVDGPVAYIHDLDSYYKSQMAFNDMDVIGKMVQTNQHVYTQTNDSPPTRYGKNAHVVNSCVANGSKIEGTVRNSVIGRGVHVCEGAIVENAVVTANVTIEKGAKVAFAVLDKSAHVHMDRIVEGKRDSIVYIKKYDEV